MIKPVRALKVLLICCAIAATTLTLVLASIGYWGLPYALKSFAPDYVEKRYGLKLRMSDAKSDPLHGALELSGPELWAAGDRMLLKLDSLQLDVGVLNSLKTRSVVIDGLTLNKPVVNFESRADGSSNYTPLFQHEAGTASAQTEESAPTVQISSLAVQDGTVKYQSAQGYDLALSSLNLSAQGFSTAGGTASLRLTANANHLGNIAAEGKLTSSPWALNANIRTEQADLPWAWATFAKQQDIRLTRGTATLIGTVDWNLAADGVMHLGLSDVQLHDLILEGVPHPHATLFAEHVAAQGLKLAVPFDRLSIKAIDAKSVKLLEPGADDRPSNAHHQVKIGKLSVGDVEYLHNRPAIVIDRVAASDGEFGFLYDPQGIQAVFIPPRRPDNSPKQTSSDGTSAKTVVQIASASLQNFTLRLRDASVPEPIPLRLTPFAMEARQISNGDDARISFEIDSVVKKQGHLAAEGWVEPAHANLEVNLNLRELGVRRFQPYISRFFNLQLAQGWIDVVGSLSLRNPPGAEPVVHFNGGFNINRLRGANMMGHEILSWDALKFRDLIAESDTNRLSVADILAQKPHATVIIQPDGKLNLANVVQQSAAGAEHSSPATERSSPSKKSRPLALVIGAVRVADGIMDFSDLTLKPNFITSISKLSGKISHLSSSEATRSDILLEGKVNETAPARIFGKVNPFSFNAYTDLTMSFTGIDLTTLSPYSGKFAGYRIDQGKLSMELRYRMEDDRLVGDNRLIIDQLALGERVDSPQATTLPVRLAIALLKDSDGRIKLELPVEGSINDPHFSMGDVLRTATTKLITSLIGSPFSIFSGLVSAFEGSHEEISTIGFASGDASLSETERTKLGKVAEGLNQRPALRIEIKGAASAKFDGRAIAERELTAQLRNAKLIESRIAGDMAGESEEIDLTDDDQRRLLGNLLRSRGAKDPMFAHAEFNEPGDSGSEREKLLSAWPVSDLQLRQLAQARARKIHDLLIAAGISDQRIYMRDVEMKDGSDGEPKTTINLTDS